MGAVCSCACGYKDLQQPQGMSQGAAGPIANRSKPFSGAVARSGALQSVAEPQPGEPGYEEWQKGQLLARTADEFGINLDPAANVAVEANNNALNNAIVNAQIRKSLQAQNQAQGPVSRFSMPVNNTFRKSTSTGGQRMSEDFQSTSAAHRDLATE